jgi:hypothetical protein
MNGSELARTSLGDGLALPTQEDTGIDSKELERWALAVAGCLQQAVPSRPSPLGLGAADSSQQVPVGWRPGVESLTPDFAAVAGGPAAGAVTIADGSSCSSDEQRIQVRVRTPECGEIAVVVERVESGLRVLLGAENPLAVTLLTRETEAVRHALESDGQSVGSLEIVQMNRLGTDLAQTRAAPSSRARRPQGSTETAPRLGQRKKKTKRLDVTG